MRRPPKPLVKEPERITYYIVHVVPIYHPKLDIDHPYEVYRTDGDNLRGKYAFKPPVASFQIRSDARQYCKDKNELERFRRILTPRPQRPRTWCCNGTESCMESGQHACNGPQANRSAYTPH